MKPLILRVRKKTFVPTIRQYIHQYRSDWKLIYVINYNESLQFLSKIQTDGRFSLWLKNNFGLGEYSVLASSKGRRGFWSFLKVLCKETTFMRLPKHESKEQRENRQLIYEKRRYGRLLKDEDVTEEQKNLIEKDLEEVDNSIGLNNEIIGVSSERRGPSPYLNSLIPVYREHGYLDPFISHKTTNLQEDTQPSRKDDEPDYKIW